MHTFGLKKKQKEKITFQFIGESRRFTEKGLKMLNTLSFPSFFNSVFMFLLDFFFEVYLNIYACIVFYIKVKVAQLSFYNLCKEV